MDTDETHLVSDSLIMSTILTELLPKFKTYSVVYYYILKKKYAKRFANYTIRYCYNFTMKHNQ